LNEGLSRGWFTYTELEALSHILLTWNLVLWPQLLKVLSVTCMMYTSVFATVLGSAVLARRFFLVTKGILTSKLALQQLNLNSLLIYIGLGISGPSYISSHHSNSTDILGSSSITSSSANIPLGMLAKGQDLTNDTTEVDMLANFLSEEEDENGKRHGSELRHQISFGLNRMSIAGTKGWSTTGDTAFSNTVDRGWYNNNIVSHQEELEKTTNTSKPLHMSSNHLVISPTRVDKSFTEFAFLYNLKCLLVDEAKRHNKIGMNFANHNHFLKT